MLIGTCFCFKLYVFTWTELKMTSTKHFSVWTIKFIFIQLPERQREWIWYLLWMSCCYNTHKLPVIRWKNNVLSMWIGFYFGTLCMKQAPSKILLLRHFLRKLLVAQETVGFFSLLLILHVACIKTKLHA